MERIAIRSVVFLLLAAGGPAFAQQNQACQLLDSPIKIDSDIYRTGGTIASTLYLGGSLFGLSKKTASFILQGPEEFLVGDLYSPFQIWHVDETGTLLTQWSTSFPGTTMTGITVNLPDGGSTYYAVDSFVTYSILEFQIPTGVPTGASVPLATGFPGIWGPLAIDNHLPGKHAFAEEIAADLFLEYDLATGSLGCSFPNPDNTGSGAFGNGVDDAADPAQCLGSTMVVTSGTAAEGSVRRVSQWDCSGALCYQTWEIGIVLGSVGETFPNEFAEYYSQAACGTGRVSLAVAGNATSTFYVICDPVSDCQGRDAPDSNVLFANASRGGLFYRVAIDNTAPLALAILRPPAGGNGKFVVHLDSGAPSAGTITSLPASLGYFCFPLFLPPAGSAAPLAIWNSLGKTDKVGVSNYFGSPIPAPGTAPVFFHLDAVGDPVNLPLGAQFTLQGLIVNPTATSPKGASVTNAFVLDVTAGI